MFGWQATCRSTMVTCDWEFKNCNWANSTCRGRLLGMLSSFVYALLEDDPQIRRIVDSVDKLNTEQGAINFVFQSDSISRQVVPSLVQLLWRSPTCLSKPNFICSI